MIHFHCLGTISQWGEVSKAKKPARPKAKDAPAAGTEASNVSNARASRGSRVVSEGGRGRGRATDRGGRGRARSSQPATNGTRQKENQQLSVPTEESPAWVTDKAKDDPIEEAEPPTEKPVLAETSNAAPPAKTWASMLRQSTAPKPAPKPKEAPAPAAPEPTAEPAPSAEPTAPEPAPPVHEEESTPVTDPVTPAPVTVIEPEVALPPSHDELTETNLEQVDDVSHPPATQTAASTTADSWDPRQTAPSATATPLSAAQQQHQAQRATSGYAASAIKAAAERTARTPSSQRRVLDQEEAVRMPGNREVDRATVQFGAFSLGGGDEDIDGDREEPETRTQPPADSPVSHPRTSLPPVAQAPAVNEQKPASALPTSTGMMPPRNLWSKLDNLTSEAVPQAPGAHGPASSQTQAPIPQAQQQYGRFGQPGAHDASQKPLDPFAQQGNPSTQPPFDNFPSQASQGQSQQPGGPFSSAPSDYSSYYTANERNPYNYYGGHFGQQQSAQGQDTAPGQRPFGSYNASQQSDNLSQYPQSAAAGHGQPRFGGASNDNQNSGHSTPNPTTQAQTQAQQAQQGQQGQQPPGAPGSQPQSHGQGYPNYNHPYYSNPYYHQYYSGYGQGGFGPYGKAGMYGQPYGVSPNAPFDHTNSPAFAQSSLHRDSGLGSGMGEYGRAGSTQGAGAPGLGGSSFGNVHDSFARGSSSFQSQGQGFNNQTQSGNPSASDDLKPYGDSKSGAGPSPSLGGARPGSATAVNSASSGQSGLPPQGSQMGAGSYTGYPSHLQGHGLHGNNAYGIGGAAGANQHGNTPYGSYGQGGFGSAGYYGGSQQQQRGGGGGGWGGNYH